MSKSPRTVSRRRKKSTCRYRKKNKTVLVITSGAPCQCNNSLWNIPDGTVTSISLDLVNGGSLLRNSGFNLDQFEREDDAELVGIVHYTQVGRGLRLETRGGFVLGMYFGPSETDSKRYACPKPSLGAKGRKLL